MTTHIDLRDITVFTLVILLWIAFHEAATAHPPLAVERPVPDANDENVFAAYPRTGAGAATRERKAA